VPDEVDRLQVIRYGREHWDAARSESEMRQAAEWRGGAGFAVCAMSSRVSGVWPSRDRAAWLRRCADRARAQWIGWTMWDYSDRLAWSQRKMGRQWRMRGPQGTGDEVSSVAEDQAGLAVRSWLPTGSATCFSRSVVFLYPGTLLYPKIEVQGCALFSERIGRFRRCVPQTDS